MVDNIASEPQSVNVLEEHAAAIKRECCAFNAAGQSRLEHAIAAGKHVIAVQERIGHGLRRWLREYGLNKTDCYDFMLLARNEESVRSSGHTSIAAALRMLRAKSVESNKSNKKSDGSPLSRAAWTKATIGERQRFLDSLGVDSFCEALSSAFRTELKRRVAGQQAAETTALGETIAAAFRQVLSLQKAGKPIDGPAMGVVPALNAINKKLTAAGLDLNNITGVNIDPTATKRKAA
jgi:hypothetical protein